MTAPVPTGQLPTRQQLDEIDALLRRMLSLPSMTSEPVEPASPSSNPTVPTPTIREDSPPQLPPAGDALLRSWRVEWPQSNPPVGQPPSVVAWGTPVSAPIQHTPWVPPATATPAPPANSVPQVPFAMAVPMNDVSSLPIAKTVPPIYVPPATNQKPTSMFVWFLIVINGAFNLLTHLLGPLGTWLRGSGRISLGWLGILMVLGAATWALGNWYGYDWPKVPLDRIRIPH